MLCMKQFNIIFSFVSSTNEINEMKNQGKQVKQQKVPLLIIHIINSLHHYLVQTLFKINNKNNILLNSLLKGH